MTLELPRRRRERGFTLVEMMVALALSLIVSAAVVALVVAIVRSNRQTLQATRLHQELRATLNLIASDMRRARSVGDPLTVALEEIAEGQVRFRFDENSLAGREALADKEAVIGRRDLEVEGLDPLAMPEPDDAFARAASALGADLEDYLSDEEGELEEVLAESDESDDEEETPLLLADDEEAVEV